ncbi:MAG: Ni/Fe hydrogenase subunit alpha [Syntrophobacterales bacterium]|nr:Ni/Fe hydrogenase subunit alpha [Syntrophobacterales bacterium]
MKSRRVRVEYLTRVEGEARLVLQVQGDRVTVAEFAIFEPPRFFEAFLQGRDFREAPDITARICGICPVAYQMSAVHALEEALGVEVPGPLRELRRLLYCGEWLASHALHAFFLHAPDFLGLPDALALARTAPEKLRLGQRLKQAGNAVVSRLGGRETHPVNVRVGGFYRVPRREELAPLRDTLAEAVEVAQAALQWFAGFEFPDFTPDYEFVALCHPGEYPMNEGRVVSSRGLEIAVSDYEQHFVEEQLPHTHALHSRLKERGAYLVGPLARYNLNYGRLSPTAQAAAREAGLGLPELNPFKSILVRAVEMLYAAEEAGRIVRAYEEPELAAVPISPRAGVGRAATEAPRGLLYHRYELDGAGLITAAKIVPPTSQNQKRLEEDLAAFAQGHLDLPPEELTWRLEQTVRNYDPCISCATHFLRLELRRKERD